MNGMSGHEMMSSESGHSFHRAIPGVLGIGVLFFALATGNVAGQEHVIKDEPAPKVHREGPSEPIADGHDLPEMEVDRWGSREAWELGIGLAAVGVLLVVAFLRWQARAIRRG